jgi:single-strand DNA-binding protein
MINITFTGNVGADPILKTVSIGGETVNVATISVAVDNGETTTWIKVSMWRGLADIAQKYIRKGNRITVMADKIRVTGWLSEDGTVRTSLEVSATKVDFSGNRNDTDSNSNSSEEDIPF